jgi:hypothetical protein
MTSLYRLSKSISNSTSSTPDSTAYNNKLFSKYSTFKSLLAALNIDTSSFDAKIHEVLETDKSYVQFENDLISPCFSHARSPKERNTGNTIDTKISTICTETSTSHVHPIVQYSNDTTSTYHTDSQPAPVLKFRSKRNKNKLFAQIDSVLHNKNDNTIVNNRKPSYASIVKFHAPNDIPSDSLISYELCKDQYSKKVSLRKHSNRTSKLSTKGCFRKKITICSNNSINNEVNRSLSSNKTPLINMTTENNEFNDGQWQTVRNSKKSSIDDALPRTKLTPSKRHPAATPPKHRYNITLGLTPATDNDNPIIITPRLLSKVLASLQYACANTQINPLDEELNPITDHEKLFAMDDDEIDKYTYVQDTNAETYRCSFQLASDFTINDFKLNRHLLTWLKQENINIARTYLLGQASVRTGFFVCTSTRGDLVEMMDKRIRSHIQVQLRYQFDLQTIWIRGSQGIATKVVMIRSPKLLTPEISKAFHHRYNSGNTVKFYPWSEYLELSDQHKDKIIRSQQQYLDEHRTMTFSGFVDFNKSTTLADPKLLQAEKQKRKIVQEPKDTVMHDTDTSTAAKIGMTVETAILTQFLSGKGKRLFKSMELPINGTIVLTITKDNLHQARKISNDAFLGSLAQLVPKDRWGLVFSDPSSILPNETPPSLLLKNNITEWIQRTTETDLVIDEQFIPKTKQRTTNKLLVFKNYSQAASLISQPPPVQVQKQVLADKTNNKENKSLSNNDPNKKRELEAWLDTMSKKIDERVTAIEKKQESDRVEMTALKSYINTVNNSVQKTQAEISKLESTLKTSIDQTIKEHMMLFSRNFEEQLQEKLQATAMILGKHNEDRFSNFRQDFDKFVTDSKNVQDEQKAENEELRAMVRQVIINSSDTEIVFSPTNGTQNHEDKDTSFDQL